MGIEDYKALLMQMLSERRFVHSVNVMETAIKLAKIYGADTVKASIAGLMHDCAREMSADEIMSIIKIENIHVAEIELKRPVLLHALVGAIVAKKKFGVVDEEILASIAAHTTGKPGMSKLDAIIYLADYIEPGRNFEGVEEIRNLAYNDLWGAMRISVAQTIVHLGEKALDVHEDTKDAYKWLEDMLG